MIQNGHSWSSIQNYTLSEIGIFYKTIILSEREKKVNSLIDSWISNNTNHKGLLDTINELIPKKVFDSPIEESSEIKKEWSRLKNFMYMKK